MRPPIIAMKILNPFIFQRSKGDLAVMNIESFERIVGKFELYKLLDEGIDDMEKGNTRPFRDILNERKTIAVKNYKILMTGAAGRFTWN